MLTHEDVVLFPLRRWAETSDPPRRFEVSVETANGLVLLNHLRGTDAVFGE
jgi:hypothetical protein